mmetsp:Transcript_31398/g.56911  ORF Transcript_31398/g.56911 Transcript_31398/m.56911 type:complete len:570 (+) Transcript_31398:101-1810(+)
MGKKGVTMSLFEANKTFGGDAAANMLPSQSEGKDFGKAKGKGLRDNTGDLDDWRTPGGRKGGGRGKGDGERSRADDGDWFSKDRPSGGGGGGGGFGGDRGGGGGGFRDRDRNRDDNTQANKDDDWRSGMGSKSGGGDRDDRDRGDRRGFGNRDGGGSRSFGNRDGDRDDGPNWRREKGEDTPSERPKLALKPRSSGADSTPTGGDKPSHPWAKKGEEAEEETPTAATEARPTKYVPPAQRKAMEEEDKKKDQRRQEEEERRAKNAERMEKEQEEKDRRRQEVLRKQEEAEEKRRKERDEKEEKIRKAEQDKLAAERARKNELKLQKEAEAKEKREAIMRASQEKKNAAKQVEGASPEKVCDEEKVAEFGEKCKELVAGGNVEAFAKKVDDMLSSDELCTVHPTARLLDVLLTHCRGKKDKDVISTVAKFAPLLNCLISSSGVHRFKVKVLVEAQRIASKMGLPRLSPASALLEAFFDGLYSAEIIEEPYFEMWAINNDDTPGKTSAMFQVNFFLEWLRKAKLEGEESSEEEDDGEGEEEEDEDDDDEEEDDDDIMANVPQGRSMARPVR